MLPEEKTAEEQEDVVEVELDEETETEQKAEQEEAQPADQEASDEDLEDYSDKVKKRIEKLTYKMREAERREKAATEYAQAVQTQLKELEERSTKIDESYLTEYDQRVSSQEEILKSQLAQAINIGDVDAQIEAQKSIARLALETERLNTAKNEFEQKKAAPAEEPQTQAPQKVDPKARAWADKNEWFGSDEPMTLTAFSIHKKLIEEEYFDPQSDDYYQELDKRIRQEFPHKFEESSPAPVARSPVAPATRSSGKSTSKKIKLTPSQVAIADKLGVTYEQYAKQLARLNS
jgi:hypothetical protein|tara:strand:- start:4714 stop:5586 length:873 start_codon:yes stop_codon:yes gene_type:complete